MCSFDVQLRWHGIWISVLVRFWLWRHFLFTWNAHCHCMFVCTCERESAYNVFNWVGLLMIFKCMLKRLPHHVCGECYFQSLVSTVCICLLGKKRLRRRWFIPHMLSANLHKSSMVCLSTLSMKVPSEWSFSTSQLLLTTTCCVHHASVNLSPVALPYYDTL